jgi:Kef-type K+ transport system membrane component KefB
VKSSAIRLGLLLLLLWLISTARALRETEGRAVALAAGALLLCALFAGRLAKGVRLPRLTGYLLIGILIGPYGFGFLPAEGVHGLELVKGLAVSLIALTAGTELRWTFLRRLGTRIAIASALLCGTLFLICWGAFVALTPFLPFMASMPWREALAVSALLSAVLVSFSPTVTIAIVQETHAKGPFTEFLMAMVIIGDLWVMILFALAAGFTKSVQGGELQLFALAGGIGWELFGSLLVGILLGVVAIVYLRSVRTERALFLCGLCFVAAELGMRLHLSPLLVALSAGAFIANVDESEATRVHVNVERIGLPVFALFFAAAGAGLKLSAVRDVGLVAVVLVIIRMVAIHGVSRMVTPADQPSLRKFLWMGLISQAGVTFGLASLVSRSFPTFGAMAEVLIIAIVSLHELIGPVLTRRALMRVGEIAPEPDPLPALEAHSG